jgi:hypothetical protein
MPVADVQKSLAIRALRPYVPARAFEASLAFYRDLGFEIERLNENLAAVSMEPVSFLLQGRKAGDAAAGSAPWMQLVVEDVEAWWKHVSCTAFQRRHGVSAVRAPQLGAWGIPPVYLWDPSGVVWTLSEAPV